MNVHIIIEHLKISSKISRSFHKLSRKTDGKWKKWTLNLKPHQIFEQNIQTVALRQRVQYELAFESIL